MSEIIDANVILRFLIRDDETLYRNAETIFKECEEGKRKLVVMAVVVAESCFVLESFFKKTKEEIASVMEVFLSQKWLKVEDRKALLSMWAFYRKNMHFVDSYLLALTQTGKYKLTTFDKVLQKKSK